MVCWWLGEEITAVCAQHRTFVPQRRWAGSDGLADVDVEDASAFLADLTGGGMGSFVSSYVFTARNFTQRIQVYGENGAILYDQAKPYELQVCIGPEMMDVCAGYGLYDAAWGLYRDEKPLPIIPVPRELMDGRSEPWERPPTQTLAPHFVAALRGNAAPLLPTFRDGLRVQEVLDAVAQSAEERRWVKLPLE
jgi:predicted dehydrogenase